MGGTSAISVNDQPSNALARLFYRQYFEVLFGVQSICSVLSRRKQLMLKTNKPSFLVFPLLGVSLLLWLTPVFADDAKQSISAPGDQNGSGGSDAGSISTLKDEPDHPHYPHDWIPTSREIMGLT